MRHNDHNSIEYKMVRNDWLDYCVLPLLFPHDVEVEVHLDDEVLGGAPDEVQVVVAILRW